MHYVMSDVMSHMDDVTSDVMSHYMHADMHDVISKGLEISLVTS